MYMDSLLAKVKSYPKWLGLWDRNYSKMSFGRIKWQSSLEREWPISAPIHMFVCKTPVKNLEHFTQCYLRHVQLMSLRSQCKHFFL